MFVLRIFISHFGICILYQKIFLWFNELAKYLNCGSHYNIDNPYKIEKLKIDISNK